MAFLTNLGGRRTWFASDWTDLLTLTGVNTPASIGDRCWYRDGACWLVRSTITTQEAASKTRWVPELPAYFGANDRSSFPIGSIDDEGIVTVSSMEPTVLADYNQAWDCLGLIFDTSGGALTFHPIASAELCYLHFRSVHMAIIGGNSVTMSMRGCGVFGGSRGYGNSDGGDAGVSATSLHGQFIVVGQGGGGGSGAVYIAE